MKEVRDKKAKKIGARRPSFFFFRRLSWRTLRRRRLILAIHTGQVRRPEQGPAREEGARRQGRAKKGRRQEKGRRKSKEREEGDPGEGCRGEEKDRGRWRELVA